MWKQASTIDWQVAESEAEWERLQAPLLPVETPAADPALRLRRFARRAVALLLLLASAGGWGWRPGTATLPPPAASVRATAQVDLAVSAQYDEDLAAGSLADQNDTAWWEPNDRRVSDLKAAVQATDAKSRPDIKLQSVEFQGDQAVVSIVTKDNSGTAPYRQTRFYRRTSTAWLETAPDAALWGAQRSLETPHFVFHFRQNDVQAVIAFAPQIDELYTTMRRNFGLPLMPTPEKLEIEVRVTEPPGHAIASFRAPNRILVPSPAVYLAPVALSDEELLVQSVALPLLANSLAEASHRHRIHSYWQPLVSALHLWQVWDVELPLAAWREEVVTWLYSDQPTTYPGHAAVLPKHYMELCAAHKLWMLSPAQLNIPLLCSEPNVEEAVFPLWRLRDPPTHLEQLTRSLSFDDPIPPSTSSVPHPGQTVILTTLIDYAVATYGHERLPLLVTGLGQYKSWETLIPAVYGVSAREFEQGWQAYLAAQYGVSLDTVRQK